MHHYVVFRSHANVRAVQVEPGKGVPSEHQMRIDEGEYFGTVVNDVLTPEAAAWRAALESHAGLIKGLVEVLRLYLEEIDWDRNRPWNPDAERIDELFSLLAHFRKEGVRDAEALGVDLEPHWLVPSPEPAPEENPDQLSLL